MIKKSLSNQMYQDKANGKITPEINNCLEQILLGCVGRFQHFHQGKNYCCRSNNYCPIQINSGRSLKACQASEIQNEFIQKRNKYLG